MNNNNNNNGSSHLITYYKLSQVLCLFKQFYKVDIIFNPILRMIW